MTFILTPVHKNTFYFSFSQIFPKLLLHSNKYLWESIFIPYWFVAQIICQSLFRSSQVVPCFTKMLNQWQNKTKEKGRWEAKMSHLLLIVQILLTAPKSLSLESHFSGSLAVRLHSPHGSVLYNRICFYIQTRPIWPPTHAPTFSFALLVGRNGDIQREPTSHMSKKVK